MEDPLNPDYAEDLPIVPAVPAVDMDVDDTGPEIEAMPHEDAVQAWERWKSKPNPANMAGVLKTVKPIIDRSVAKFPRYNKTVLGGEAKRLAISAVKSYDPAQGTKLSSHIYNHVKPLGRFSADLGSAVRKTRLERDRTAQYMGALRDLTETNNREPSDDELRDHMGVDGKTLFKMRLAARGEVSEGQLEYLPSEEEEEDPRMALWLDYTYRDLDPKGKLIVDYKLGRNGREKLTTEQAAEKLGLHPDYVNRKAGEIAKRILDGANSQSAQQPTQPV